MGLYTGGLIFGMVSVLVNWWAYTWGAYIRGAYIRRFTVYRNNNRTAIIDNKWYEQGVKYTVGRSLKTTAGRLRSSCYHLFFLDFQLYIRLLFSFLFLYETLFFFIICICRVLVLTAAFFIFRVQWKRNLCD